MHGNVQMGAGDIHTDKLSSLLSLHRSEYERRDVPCCRRELARIGDRCCITQYRRQVPYRRSAQGWGDDSVCRSVGSEATADACRCPYIPAPRPFLQVG
ncbi:hypothetical protein D3C72_2101180 [compost metagenome]